MILVVSREIRNLDSILTVGKTRNISNQIVSGGILPMTGNNNLGGNVDAIQGKFLFLSPGKEDGCRCLTSVDYLKIFQIKQSLPGVHSAQSAFSGDNDNAIIIRHEHFRSILESIPDSLVHLACCAQKGTDVCFKKTRIVLRVKLIEHVAGETRQKALISAVFAGTDDAGERSAAQCLEINIDRFGRSSFPAHPAEPTEIHDFKIHELIGKSFGPESRSPCRQGICQYKNANLFKTRIAVVNDICQIPGILDIWNSVQQFSGNTALEKTLTSAGHFFDISPADFLNVTFRKIACDVQIKTSSFFIQRIAAYPHRSIAQSAAEVQDLRLARQIMFIHESCGDFRKNHFRIGISIIRSRSQSPCIYFGLELLKKFLQFIHDSTP